MTVTEPNMLICKIRMSVLSMNIHQLKILSNSCLACS